VKPWQELAQSIRAIPGAPNVYEAPPSQVVPPAVVLRPDAPWIARERYGADLERYVAVLVATASDPASALVVIDDLRRTVEQAVDATEGWSFVDAGTVLVDETTGVPLLASSTRLAYRGDCTNGGS
jgi:hypothetical protein